MSVQRIAISLSLADPTVDPEAFVPVFHDWIRRAAVDGLLIDVARYAHVHNGPGVLLIGHEGDYAIDLSAGGPALRYTLKRDVPDAPRDAVALVLRRLLRAAAEAAVVAGGRVETGELVVEIRDRLRAPNTPETLAALGPGIAAALGEALGEVALGPATLHDDARAPFAVRVGVSGSGLSDAIAAQTTAGAVA